MTDISAPKPKKRRLRKILIWTGSVFAVIIALSLIFGEDPTPAAPVKPAVVAPPVHLSTKPPPLPTTKAPTTTVVPTTTPPPVVVPKVVPPPVVTPEVITPEPVPTHEVSYANCAAVRAAGAAPIHSGDPGYSTDLDRDEDGIACE